MSSKTLTPVQLIQQKVDSMQKHYIELAKKNRKRKSQVDSILTATTIIKMHLENAIKIEKQIIIDAHLSGFMNKGQCTSEEYYNKTFKP